MSNLNSCTLKTLANKNTYEKYRSLVKRGTLSKEELLILDGYEYYFSYYPTDEDVDFTKYYSYFSQNLYTQLAQSEYITVQTLCSNAAAAEPKAIQVVLNHLNDEWMKTKLTELTLSKFDSAQLDSLLEIYNKNKKVADEADPDVELFTDPDLFEGADRKEGLHWRLSLLNDAIGCPQIGDFIIFAGGVGSGKTALCVSEVCNMAQQLAPGEKILWLNNEGKGNRVRRRILSCVLNRPTSVIIQNQEKALKKYTSLMGGDPNRIVFIKASNMRLRKLVYYLKKYKPKLMVLDQADNLHNDSVKGNDVLKIHDLYATIREIANEYCPIIAVSQAKNTTFLDKESGQMKWKRYLHLNDLDFSNIAKQATAEAIVLVGRDDAENIRYLHVAKEKTEDRRGFKTKAEVKFQPEYSLYTDFP
jgi:replicative DNA helicase